MSAESHSYQKTAENRALYYITVVHILKKLMSIFLTIPKVQLQGDTKNGNF
jgi:hypothetical protein